MYTDKKGRVYNNEAELDAAIKCLEEDAAFLRTQIDKYNDTFVKPQVEANAKHSAEMAAHLRSLRTT